MWNNKILRKIELIKQLKKEIRLKLEMKSMLKESKGEKRMKKKMKCICIKEVEKEEISNMIKRRKEKVVN